MQVDIVIVNWNSGTQLYQCLSSISRLADNLIASVVVVDNASSDGSINRVGIFDLPLQLIKNDYNLGFARACNQGALIGSASYLLFLNPDTILYAHSVAAPLAFMMAPENESIGICGIQLADHNGKISHTCASFPSLRRLTAQITGLNRLPGLESSGIRMSAWSHGLTRVVDQVIGAFFFIRRNVFESLDGFDERFFVYFEEVDLSYRAWRRGWKSVYLTEAQAFHEGGGTSRQVMDERLYYSLQSRLLYVFKHWPSWQAWVILYITILVEPVTRTVDLIIRGHWAGLKYVLKSYRMLARNVSVKKRF